MQVIEQLIAQPLFDSAGCAQQTTTPDIAKETDKQRDSDHVYCIGQQSPGIYFKGRQIIDGPFDDPRNEELEHINDDQAEQSDYNFGAVFNKIGLDQGSC